MLTSRLYIWRHPQYGSAVNFEYNIVTRNLTLYRHKPEAAGYLYVSDYPEEWEQDRADIREGQQLVYVYNKDDPALSELGYIGVTRTEAAGLHRTW